MRTRTGATARRPAPAGGVGREPGRRWDPQTISANKTGTCAVVLAQPARVFKGNRAMPGSRAHMPANSEWRIALDFVDLFATRHSLFALPRLHRVQPGALQLSLPGERMLDDGGKVVELRLPFQN